MAGTSKRKTTEKPMDETNFGVEIELDSTAPLEKIIRNLFERERFSKAYRLYNLLLVQRRRTLTRSQNLHYILPGHPLKAFKGNWDGVVKPGYFEPFQYKCTMPKIISQMRNVGKSDPVTDLMQVKRDWKSEIATQKKLFSLMYKRRKLKKFSDDVVHCPKYIIDLAAKMECDPEPNFDSNYNWYYAGHGNMQLICFGWVDYMLHSDFSTVYLTRLHKEEMTLEQVNEASYDCNDEDILETICSTLNIVALRTMNKIIILKIIEIDNHLYFDLIKQFDSEMPFTSISFDKFHKNMLYATRLDGSLSIVNLDRLKARSVKLKRHSDTNKNNWNSVIAGERGSYMHIEKSKVTFYDKRTNRAVNSWDNLNKVVDEVHCNDITAATRCDDSPSLYVATEHHLFLLDTRVGYSSKPKAGQRWTHGLRCPPTYLSVGKADHNKEFIVLASQWCADTCVVSNYADSVVNNYDIPGVSMPYHPPYIMDALNEARMRMLCLDLNNPIDGRLAASTTGLAVVDQGENFAILTRTSLGDVFLRTLYPEYMESFVEDDSVQKLSEWSQHYKLEKKDFEVSSVTDIANIWKKLRRVPDDYDFGLSNRKDEFNEQEIFDAFENEELVPELLDAWVNEPANETAGGDDTSLALNLHYSDSDGE